ncbi:thioredoxin [Mastigocoleus testarum]|uniref:Thioredoxin n=1 Tax=Mastigocoleus testarum BC008 TaxID=371196 RepID=A0A0V7ZZ16_9CYAN|nr:thioredoxin [Mastigocoleus testarum]KST69373.1 thioredoxin [Mastigocoleus testarum BC008]KST69526.1 thioredoxin [Mastigocoleus testarum BC008]
MNTVEYIKETEFDTLSSSDGVFVFDFTATWCGPCKMIAPMMDRLAQEYEEHVRVAKVDLDENPSLAKRLGIRSIPVVMIYKDGSCIEKVVGVVPYEKFKTIVTELL